MALPHSGLSAPDFSSMDPSRLIAVASDCEQPGSSRLAMHARLCAIASATTRTIVKTEGLDAFTMRRLSEELGVTPQTLYNNLGPRDLILATALTDYDSFITNSVRGAMPGIGGILKLENIYGSCLSDEGNFAKEAMRFIFSPKHKMLELIMKRGANVLRSWLEALHLNCALNDRTDLAALAHHLCWIHSATLYEWALLGGNVNDVRARLNFGVRVALMGSASDEGRRELECFLERE